MQLESEKLTLEVYLAAFEGTAASSRSGSPGSC
jgi:hypothetical protein